MTEFAPFYSFKIEKTVNMKTTLHTKWSPEFSLRYPIIGAILSFNLEPPFPFKDAIPTCRLDSFPDHGQLCFLVIFQVFLGKGHVVGLSEYFQRLIAKFFYPFCDMFHRWDDVISKLDDIRMLNGNYPIITGLQVKKHGLFPGKIVTFLVSSKGFVSSRPFQFQKFESASWRDLWVPLPVRDENDCCRWRSAAKLRRLSNCGPLPPYLM